MELHLDPEPDENGEIHTALPPRFESWRRRSATGAILTGIGLGLRAALEPERDEPSIIVQTSGTPPSDLPVEAEMGGLLPADKVVKIRPWLLAAEGGDSRSPVDTAPGAAVESAPGVAVETAAGAAVETAPDRALTEETP